MIELTQLENEVKAAWPLQYEGTMKKWAVIRQTVDLLHKVTVTRKHTPEETMFMSKYQEMRTATDDAFFVAIERGEYDTKYLPYDLAAAINSLYNSINHL